MRTGVSETAMGWYEKCFGQDYMLVYKHRDTAGAYEEVRAMIDWLDLPSGATVLDLCCGTGRHSMALADFGFRVTGVDLSEVLLAEARSRDTSGRVCWVQGDMRAIPAEGPFDAVVNLFTSFGYFRSDEENGRVLREMARVLRPRGQFIVDYLNPVYVKANLVPHSVRTEGDVVIEEIRDVEDGFVTKRIAVSEPGKPVRTYVEQVKCYEQEQLEEMAASAGLRIRRILGGYDGSDYDRSRSPRFILTGWKEESPT